MEAFGERGGGSQAKSRLQSWKRPLLLAQALWIQPTDCMMRKSSRIPVNTGAAWKGGQLTRQGQGADGGAGWKGEGSPDRARQPLGAHSPCEWGNRDRSDTVPTPESPMWTWGGSPLAPTLLLSLSLLAGSACDGSTTGIRDWLMKNLGEFCLLAQLSELQAFYPALDGVSFSRQCS